MTNEIAEPLVMEVAEVFHIDKIGTVAIGQVACEEIDWPDRIRIVGDGFMQEATVGGVEQYNKIVHPGRRGELVGMLLMGQVHREQLPITAGMKIYLVEKKAKAQEESQEKPRPWWQFWSRTPSDGN